MSRLGDSSHFEWDIEEVIDVPDDDHDEGDIQEHRFQASAVEVVAHLKNTPAAGCRWEVVLVLTTDDERSWAYVDMDTMTLPPYFEDANGSKTRKVAKRFHDELARALKIS